MNVLPVRTNPRHTLHALLRGAADFANNNLAFEWAEDYEPELDYIDARLALRLSTIDERRLTCRSH